MSRRDVVNGKDLRVTLVSLLVGFLFGLLATGGVWFQAAGGWGGL